MSRALGELSAKGCLAEGTTGGGKAKLVGTLPAGRQQQQQQQQQEAHRTREVHRKLGTVAHRKARMRQVRAHAVSAVNKAGTAVTVAWVILRMLAAKLSVIVRGAALQAVEADSEQPRNAERTKRARHGSLAAARVTVFAKMGYIDRVGFLGNMGYGVLTESFVGLKVHNGLQGPTSGHWAKINVGLMMMLLMIAMERGNVNAVEGPPRIYPLIPW